jgi:ssDNA-binding Zn-finger/Zn-ribbon topoisomerase 1
MRRVGGGHRSRLGSAPALKSFTTEQIERMPTFGPDCPRCSAITVQRDRRDGTSSFWGCRNYPRCKGTLPLE